MNATPTPSLRPPRQKRSQQTLDRLLDAAESMLETRPFESISVAELVRAAGTSVGAFYTRFRDKAGMLSALYGRYDEWIVGRTAEMAAAKPWEEQSLDEVSRWLASELVQFFAGRRHLIRAMALHARSSPESIDEETRRRRARQMSFLLDALLSRRAEITHPDPERAVELALFMAASTCREWILFREAPHSTAVHTSNEELEREVARQVFGYLTAGPPPTSTSTDFPTSGDHR